MIPVEELRRMRRDGLREYLMRTYLDDDAKDFRTRTGILDPIPLHVRVPDELILNYVSLALWSVWPRDVAVVLEMQLGDDAQPSWISPCPGSA